MRILKADEAHFAELTDYPFKPNYTDVGPGLRMHYVDEGGEERSPLIMLHGEPAWSYLYRKVIPPVVRAGHRVLAPDLIGFGKSDKPAHHEDYSHDSQLLWLERWLDALALQNITLVCQNGGSLLGLRLLARQPERFECVIVGNGMLPPGSNELPRTLGVWRTFSRYSPWFPVGHIMQLGTARTLTPAEVSAYKAPFPSERHKAGARAFPGLLPKSPHDATAIANLAAWQDLRKWRKPFITCFSSGDPFSRGLDRYFQRHIPGAYGQSHITLSGGHFLPEDSPQDFARVIIDACKPWLAV